MYLCFLGIETTVIAAAFVADVAAAFCSYYSATVTLQLLALHVAVQPQAKRQDGHTPPVYTRTRLKKLSRLQYLPSILYCSHINTKTVRMKCGE